MIGFLHDLPSSHPILWSRLSHYLPGAMKRMPSLVTMLHGYAAGEGGFSRLEPLHPWVGSWIKEATCSYAKRIALTLIPYILGCKTKLGR
jgi:hypothetical protein